MISQITSSLAGLSQDKWPELNFENNAVKGFELFIGSDFEVYQKPVAMYQFRSQKSEQCTIQLLAETLEIPGHMSWVSFR